MLGKCFYWVDQNVSFCSKLADPLGSKMPGQCFSKCAPGNPHMGSTADVFVWGCLNMIFIFIYFLKQFYFSFSFGGEVITSI